MVKYSFDEGFLCLELNNLQIMEGGVTAKIYRPENFQW